MQEGIYEQLITQGLQHLLDQTDLLFEKETIDRADAARILSQYVSKLIEKELIIQDESGKDLKEQVSYINHIISTVVTGQNPESQDDQVSENAEQLLALVNPVNQAIAIRKSQKGLIERPDTSIAQSSLFTGAVMEPQLLAELKKEIISCHRIDMLVSFIKWSGLRQLITELQSFTENGGTLRVITTSYMGATDIKAVDELSKLLNTEIKVSYDTKHTRLHAKAYIFYRKTGFSTAYVGSSNMSNAALSSGLEWNVKVTAQDLPETMEKIEATFFSYWNSKDFVLYTSDQKAELEKAIKAEKYQSANSSQIYLLDARPYSYQKGILDRLQAERKIRGYYKNLVVAATGTGKTVIAAFDYLNYRKEHPNRPCRLLFVAHREEILDQSIKTFRAVLKDANFGDVLVGGHIPASLDHLFVSVQSLHSKKLMEITTADFYSYMVIDEFHHSAAPTYESILRYYQPEILLGLTATPERMDGKDILSWFDGRIAAEIRLPEAIDQKLLCPFQYFGVADTVDLNKIRWSRGGYDRSELENVYVFSREIAKTRADHVVRQVIKYTTDIDETKGLGFCVSVEHANFMCEFFNQAGIASMTVTGATSEEDRQNARVRLSSGDVKFIFTVDVYNEGVDIPEINTVLFLRPTESLTIFLQQLGRGLRLSEGKDCLTVLDFIGQANKRYHFEDKFAALLTSGNRDVTREIKRGFRTLPKGCYIQLKKKAADNILENIRTSYGTSAGLVSRIATFEEETGKQLTLAAFLDYYHLSAGEIYKFNSFSRLCVMAGLLDDFTEPLEEILAKAFSRFACADSRRWIRFILQLLTEPVSDLDEYGEPVNVSDDVQNSAFSDAEIRMLQMFQFTVWGKSYEECGFSNLMEPIKQIRTNPVMCRELIELLQYQYNQIDLVDSSVDLGFDCPLDLHCTYSRDQIMVAMDFLKPGTIREGVKYLKDKKLDIFFITLNKSDKEYSPTTMYKDYSINENMFHWQSQSTTSETSSTGQRYIHHVEQGSKVVLFVREYKEDPLTRKAVPYTYLGTAKYMYHEGSKPMSITWHLDEPIPAKYLPKTNKLLIV